MTSAAQVKDARQQRRWTSPLRYPGGKGRMSAYLGDLFEQQIGWLDVEVFVEPFAGGAGAGLTLLDSGVIDDLWLTEKNPALAAFWRTICTAGDVLATRVEHTDPSMTIWHDSREVIAAAERGAEVDDLTLGYAAFIMNRCSRSGIPTSNVGPIGGKAQQGRWTIASRFNAAELAQRIRRIASLSHGIRILEGDGVEYVAELADSGVEEEVMIFADPPYVADGPRLYRHSFTVADHVTLAMTLAASPARWVLTYDPHHLVEHLYRDFRILEYTIPHTSNRQHIDYEYAIFSDNMCINPDGVPLNGGTATWLDPAASSTRRQPA